MKTMFSIVLSVLATTANADESYLSDDMMFGVGIEYRFGASSKLDRFDMYSFAGSVTEEIGSYSRVSHSDFKQRMELSCVPEESSPDGKCSVGWTPIIYIIALPFSLYLYSKMYEEVK